MPFGGSAKQEDRLGEEGSTQVVEKAWPAQAKSAQQGSSQLHAGALMAGNVTQERATQILLAQQSDANSRRQRGAIDSFVMIFRRGHNRQAITVVRWPRSRLRHRIRRPANCPLPADTVRLLAPIRIAFERKRQAETYGENVSREESDGKERMIQSDHGGFRLE